MSDTIPLESGMFYHIYNRGNNRETIFLEDRNCLYFLTLYEKYIPVAIETFAYCLMGNHFHLLVRVKDVERPDRFLKPIRSPSRAFSDLFNAYAKSFNSVYGRTGTLFERPFRRKVVDSEKYLTQIVLYLHWNPQKHGIVDDFRRYLHSSYQTILADNRTFLQRDEVLEWFGGRAGFTEGHNQYVEEKEILRFIIED